MRERFASYWNAFVFDNAYQKSDVTQNSDRRADHLHVKTFQTEKKSTDEHCNVQRNFHSKHTNSKWQRMNEIQRIFATVSILSILSLVNQIL